MNKTCVDWRQLGFLVLNRVEVDNLQQPAGESIECPKLTASIHRLDDFESLGLLIFLEKRSTLLKSKLYFIDEMRERLLLVG